MNDLFKEVAKEYITYSTGQANKLFPRADSWMLYSLSSKNKYNNCFPPFQENKDALFTYMRDKLGSPDKLITAFYLVKHTNRSYQLPISDVLHGYIPLTKLNLVISNMELKSRQHIEDLSMIRYSSHKLKNKTIDSPKFFDHKWHTLPFVTEGDTYFYVEFES